MTHWYTNTLAHLRTNTLAHTRKLLRPRRKTRNSTVDSEIEAAARANAGTCIDCGDIAKLHTRPKRCGQCEDEARLRALRVVYRKKSHDLIDPYRNRPCIDCGIKLPSECMDLDHVRGKRLFGVSGSAGRMRGKKVILDEISKCDSRCPKCHRLRHYWVKHPDDPFFIDNPPHPNWLAIQNAKQEDQ